MKLNNVHSKTRIYSFLMAVTREKQLLNQEEFRKVAGYLVDYALEMGLISKGDQGEIEREICELELEELEKMISVLAFRERHAQS